MAFHRKLSSRIVSSEQRARLAERSAPRCFDFMEVVLMLVDAALSLGRCLRILRVARGLRQRDVAASAGLSPSVVSMIETGDRQPRDQELRAILKALGARPEDVGLPKGAV